MRELKTKELEHAVRYPLIALAPNCVIYREIRRIVAGLVKVYPPAMVRIIVSIHHTSNKDDREWLLILRCLGTISVAHGTASLPETAEDLMSERIPQDKSGSISRRFQILTIGLLVVSVALNVALARRNKDLNAALLSVKAEQSLRIGSSLPPIEAFDLAHNFHVLKYDAATSPTIFYVFSPQCGWCAKNASNLRLLSERIKGRYWLIGLSLSSAGLEEYVTQEGIDFPVYTNLSPKSVAAYRLGGTPTTIVVSADGKLLREWKGAYIGDSKREIEEYFDVSFPVVTWAKE